MCISHCWQQACLQQVGPTSCCSHPRPTERSFGRGCNEGSFGCHLLSSQTLYFNKNKFYQAFRVSCTSLVCVRGFAPSPHFILCLDTKNEARKVKTKQTPGWSRYVLCVLSGQPTVLMAWLCLYLAICLLFSFF